MNTYVMGDIHGAHKAMVQCLQRAGFDYRQDTLIQLGDIADGYDEVYACVEELLKIDNRVAIRGNHDQWFFHFMETGHHPQYWAQGGEGTLRSYLKALGLEGLIPLYGNTPLSALQPTEIPPTHRAFFASQRLYHIDGNNNCYVHAGFDRTLPINQQPKEIYYWDRNLWLQAQSWEATNRNKKKKSNFHQDTPFREVFIGHTRTLMWDTDQPMKAANIYNIDTGGGGGGRITIMNIATHEYWQSDPVNELYKVSYR